MATFASRDTSEKTEETEEKEETPTAKDVLGIVKTGPKKLDTRESSSISTLKNEFLKRKDRLEGTIKQTGTHVIGKSNLLSTRKDEKERLERESKNRLSRISENERELRREEAEQMAASKQKLREKAELYERMSDGKLVLANADDSSVEFLVDFDTKKRKRDEERAEERERRREEEGAAPQGFGRAPVPEHYHHSEEQRVYGTSHMRLSLNENKRKEEIEKLLEMSKTTDAERAKRKEMDEKREEMRRQKINKIRERHGLEPLPEPVPEPKVSLEEIPMPAPQETPEQRHARLMKSDREWDRGKGLYTTWIEKQRDDRDDDFRPPDSYFH
ncbi:unnamed protein product [Caenorhabditis sp. 36 PRJEB53466]|nr:unnamed protein product [Caenorhabditis sp. 36 PRJEB53466]